MALAARSATMAQASAVRTRVHTVRAVARASPMIAPRPFTAAKQQLRARTGRMSTVVVRAAEVKVGSKMDDFADYYRVLRATDGKTYQLASFKGKQPVVLFFYPKAATPGCTKEVCKFRDEYKRFQDAGAVVFGVSGDSVEDNKAFASAQNVPFPLLSDSNNILRKTFGIKGDFLGLLPGRQTYVFDTAGVCVMAFNDQLNAEKHVDEALAALKKVTVNA